MVSCGIEVYVVKWFYVAKSGEVAEVAKRKEKWGIVAKSG